MAALFDIDAEYCQDTNRALKLEWLASNGQGGFASSTVCGCNIRKYHGLLIAPLGGANQRRLFLAQYQEKVMAEGEEFPLYSAPAMGGSAPQANDFLVNFRLEPFPVFTYMCGECEIEKRLFMPHGKNAVVVRYRLLFGSDEVMILIKPVVTARSIHTVLSSDFNFSMQYHTPDDQHLVYEPSPDLPKLRVIHNAIQVSPEEARPVTWEYPIEAGRGYEATDQLLELGEMEFHLTMQNPAYLIATTEQEDPDHPLKLEREELRRHNVMVKKSVELHPLEKQEDAMIRLVNAADSFIVSRNNAPGVIAGYPWFSEWGRDTMISFPGLFLVTRRFEEARALLLSHLRHYREGLFPNTFSEDGSKPFYNTVDTSLWFIHAVYAYYLASGDKETIRTPLFDVVKDIIKHYINGTRFGIHQDNDGLILSGEEGWQLTWMDVKVNGEVVTPRIGKNVEICALWYHALRIASFLSDLLDDEEAYAAYGLHAEKVQKSFEEKFWFEQGRYLYDTLGPGGPDASIRPNQIFALSLPYPILTGEKAGAVLQCIDRFLLTPFGLRSLAPGHPDYRPRYGGDLRSRDFAYHQGTVWPWLMGPYIDALLNVKGKTRLTAIEGLQLLDPFWEHLGDAGVGSISELFDGDPPHSPGGCFAQAWSVAELLRVYVKLLQLAQPRKVDNAINY